MDSGRLIAFHRKPFLLKDFLMEEMSSCSSNGFNSFPRRKCCGFLRDLDLKNRQLKEKLKRKNSTAKFGFKPVRSVLSAVKRLHLAAVGKKQERCSVVKFFGFWKRKSEVKMIEHWKSLDQLMKEDSYPSDGSHRWPAATECLSGVGKNDVVEEAVIDDREVGAKNDDVSDESTISSVSYSNCSTKTKENEEKEQLSPLSVLDCSLNESDYDNDEVSSPFQQRLARMEGTKKKLMKKLHMFESLAKLEPLDLTKRFTESDNESSETSLSNTAEPLEDDEKQVEEIAMELFHRLKVSSPSHDDLKLKYNILLIDFFKASINHQHDKEGLLSEAQDWINGRKSTLVENNMKVCLSDMEKGGEWKIWDQENKEVALELECEVFNVILDELLLDILM